MRKSTVVSALTFSAVGIGAIIWSSAFANAAQAATAIDGSTYAIVTPAFDGTGGNPNTSYIRLFAGTSAATTFTITIVGSQTGKVYGQAFTVQIPKLASPQYSLGALLGLAGSSAGAGAANGDTSFALFIKNPSLGSGYQHVTFNGNSLLFDNSSVCNNGLLPTATLSSGFNVLTNVHTDKLGGYPSVVYFFNDTNAAITDTITITDAGVVGSDGKTLSTTAGNIVGSTTIQIPANTTVTKNFTDLETAVKWTPSATQLHANILVNNSASAPGVILGQSIHNNALAGDINMTTACSVNTVSTGGGSGSGGNSSAAASFIPSGAAGTTYPLTASQGFTSFAVSNGAAIVAGTTSVPIGSLTANAAASIVTTASGFTFTLPDGKTVTYDLSAGAADNFGSDFETLTTDGTRNVEVKIQNGKTPTLSYSTFGTWDENDTSSTPLNVGTLAAGIATTVAQMPTTGTATYSGDITGFGFSAAAFGQIKSGTVSLSVNFATKTITGSVTNVITKGASDNSPSGTMNGMTLTGSISGAGVTITATATAAAAGTTVDVTGATGAFSGTFSGPNATELVTSGAMTGGASTLLAAFGAHQ
jgi:hypothetical protein